MRKKPGKSRLRERDLQVLARAEPTSEWPMQCACNATVGEGRHKLGAGALWTTPYLRVVASVTRRFSFSSFSSPREQKKKSAKSRENSLFSSDFLLLCFGRKKTSLTKKAHKKVFCEKKCMGILGPLRFGSGCVTLTAHVVRFFGKLLYFIPLSLRHHPRID